jgi:lauroyl/myristoyl acyltransferase
LVEVSRTGDYDRDLLENTQRFTKIVEEVVREYPDQWFWLHSRWVKRAHFAKTIKTNNDFRKFTKAQAEEIEARRKKP